MLLSNTSGLVVFCLKEWGLGGEYYQNEGVEGLWDWNDYYRHGCYWTTACRKIWGWGGWGGWSHILRCDDDTATPADSHSPTASHLPDRRGEATGEGQRPVHGHPPQIKWPITDSQTNGGKLIDTPQYWKHSIRGPRWVGTAIKMPTPIPPPIMNCLCFIVYERRAILPGLLQTYTKKPLKRGDENLKIPTQNV